MLPTPETLGAALVLLLGGAVPAFAGCLPDSIAALYDYDRTAPTDPAVVSTSRGVVRGVVLEDITFASPVAGRVTATVAAPEGAPVGSPEDAAAGSGRGLRAGIVFLHWGQGDRSEFAWEACLYARAGAVCITVDAPWARPAEWRQPGESFERPDLTRAMYIQNVVDLRRAVDVLLSRGDVDSTRLAYVGHSFGATQGGVLAGVEKRLRAFVLVGGLPSVTDFSLTGARNYDELGAVLDERVPPEMREAHRRLIEPLSPARFVPCAAPSAIFMQFGLFDSWIPTRAAEAYFEAASEPREVAWYPTSHEFNDPAVLADRAAWLRRHVGIEDVRPLLAGALEGSGVTEGADETEGGR